VSFWVRVRVMAALSCLYWGFGALALLLLSAVVRPFLSLAKSRALGKAVIYRAFQVFVLLLRWTRIVRCEFEGFERLDREPKNGIIAPNHPAIWDAVFVMSRIPGLTCILKASLLNNPLLTGGARMAQFIPNDPATEFVKRCIADLKSGNRVLLFPEGTRTHRHLGTVVNEFRGGIAIIARHAGVPVWPLFITTNSDFGRKTRSIWQMPEAEVHIKMRLGDPVFYGAEESTDDFLLRLRAVYVQALSSGPSPT
jgi:1-acyl-sn-glycerol-3-phosphate acyltransferase